MRGHIRHGGIAAMALVLLAIAPQMAAAQDETLDPSETSLTPCAVQSCEPHPALGWEGEYRAQRITFRSTRSGARLSGTVLAPTRRAVAGHRRRARYPGVVVIPGSMNLAREEDYHWSARELASHGYVVVGVDPQGVGRSATFGDPPCEPDTATEDPEYPYPCRGVPFQERENFNDAAEGGLDFLLSRDNPFRSLVDRRALGLAGHSLGGAAVGEVQERDSRVKAIVAWDALHADRDGTDQCGPTSHAISAHVPTELYSPLVPRTPAMGLTSEMECQTFYDRDPDNRKRPYYHWRDAGLPTMVVVFDGVEHGDFGQAAGIAPGSERDLKLRRFEWYTRAWFDLHLKGDERAAERLLARTVVGATLDELLSHTWRSAAYLPSAGVECEDLRLCG